MTDEEILKENQKEIFRLRAVVRDLGGKLDEIVEFAKDVLDNDQPYLYGQEERSSDLYECGYVDGEYNALVTVLTYAGEEHEYKTQGGI